MDTHYECFVCQLVFEPKEVAWVRRLQEFQGYTVDLRLKQFRKISLDALPEFIEFDSEEGQALVAAMHEEAEVRANAMFPKNRV